jgi:hypothetical protein
VASQGPVGNRHRGAFVGLYLLYFLVSLPLVAQVVGRHIAYLSPHFYAVEAMTLYLLGTRVSSLLSSHRSVRWFGLVSFLSFVAAYEFYVTWFISVWCFFAAILGVTVLLRLPGRVSRGPTELNHATA